VWYQRQWRRARSQGFCRKFADFGADGTPRCRFYDAAAFLPTRFRGLDSLVLPEYAPPQRAYCCQCHLKSREKNAQFFRSRAIRNRKAMKHLYATPHVKPSGSRCRYFSVLSTSPSDSLASVLKQLEGTYLNRRI